MPHGLPGTPVRRTPLLTLFLLPVLVFLTGCDDEAIDAGPSEPGVEITRQSTPPPPRPTPTSSAEKDERATVAPEPEETTFSPPGDDPAQKRLESLQEQIEQNEAQLRAERDRFEQERRQKAIDEYEAAMAHYLAEIEWLYVAIQKLEEQRVTAYTDFEKEHGVPFVRFNTNCGNATDFFACVNASASMPTYEFSIDQAETNIRLYRQAINALIYPY